MASNVKSRLFISNTIILLSLAIPFNVAHAFKNELSVFSGYRAGGNFEDINTGAMVKTDEGSAYGVIYDGYLDKDSAIEVIYSKQSTNLRPGGTFTGSKVFDLDIEYFHFGGIRYYPAENYSGYVVGTMGATHFQPDRAGLDSETRFSMAFGGGARIPVTKAVGLRFDVRGYGTLFKGSGAVFCSNGVCDVRVSGSSIWQIEMFAGLSLGF